MYVLDIRGDARPVRVDQGGELIRSTIDFRGKAGFPSGIPLTITPRWSPGGDWIAFLKREGGTTQVWRADAAGRGSSPITNVPYDVDDFRISADGAMIIFSARPGLVAARQRILTEGLRGFRYDDRFSAGASNRPFPPMPIPAEIFVQQLATGTVRSASPTEAAQMGLSPEAPPGAIALAMSLRGRRAWLASPSARIIASSNELFAEDRWGKAIRCGAAACTGRISRPSWSIDGKRVRYFRLEGPGWGTTTIYEWQPGHSKPYQLYSTQDVLDDCEPWNDKFICVVEGSSKPRRIEILDPVKGASELLFDPNPDFRSLRLGHVERLSWRNRFGIDTIGDLVLPTDYKPGTRYPLIIVQYDTRGFLRGGTGDEFPIQAFANRGFAVLSFSRPPPTGLLTDAKDAISIDKANLENFSDRWSVQSSLEVGVRLLISRGIADPARVGITGLSDGGSTIGFGLLHSNLFAAAATSSCCWDSQILTRVGPAAAKEFVAEGYPRLIDDGTAFWKEVSLAANARRIDTPILLQMADDEYMSALNGYTALREAGAPIDLYVFPNEHHVKWQPAHKLAVAERALDWFDYWLRDRRSRAPDRASELAHWDLLRHEQSARDVDDRRSP